MATERNIMIMICGISHGLGPLGAQTAIFYRVSARANKQNDAHITHAYTRRVYTLGPGLGPENGHCVVARGVIRVSTVIIIGIRSQFASRLPGLPVATPSCKDFTSLSVESAMSLKCEVAALSSLNSECAREDKHRFVDTLRDSGFVGPDTTYDEAALFLGRRPTWRSVDEDMRRAIFNVYKLNLRPVWGTAEHLRVMAPLSRQSLLSSAAAFAQSAARRSSDGFGPAAADDPWSAMGPLTRIGPHGVREVRGVSGGRRRLESVDVDGIMAHIIDAMRQAHETHNVGPDVVAGTMVAQAVILGNFVGAHYNSGHPIWHLDSPDSSPGASNSDSADTPPAEGADASASAARAASTVDASAACGVHDQLDGVSGVRVELDGIDGAFGAAIAEMEALVERIGAADRTHSILLEHLMAPCRPIGGSTRRRRGY